jgi:quercetin dioxygenase-like cupin family protein
MSMRLAAAAALTALISQESPAFGQSADRVVPGALQWKQIVPGAHFAAAYGDWEKGAHGKYVRFVKGVQIPMHRHSNDYHAVAISGQLVNLFEGGRRVEIAPGDYFYMAAMRAHSHECLSDDGCLFYTYGTQHWDFVPYEAPAQRSGSSERGH